MNNEQSGKHRKNIAIDDVVDVIQKEHQTTGELTQGQVKRILTKAKFHPHGIKVLLDTGEVGRVQKVYPDEDF